MEYIKINSLSLRNFKGVRNAEYEFGDLVNVVKGRNGVGKTTIADAICWVLFGTNQAGNTKFGVKTKDENGNEIPDVEHSVEIVLSINDVVISSYGGQDSDVKSVKLTRILKESRSKDGSVTNTYTYKVDDEVETAGDFKKAVSVICPEKVFRLCSSPNAFVQMEWSEQRKMLIEMFGEPSVEEIMGGEKRFDPIKKLLEKNDFDKVLKHLYYMRKEVQKKLDDVPVRLSELDKVLPEAENWESLKKQVEEKDYVIKENVQKISLIENGGGKRVENETLNHKIDFLQKRKMNMQEGARRQSIEILGEYTNAKCKLEVEITETKSKGRRLKADIAALEDNISREEEYLKHLESQKQDGSVKWKAVLARTWGWDDNLSYCPTCGQALPMDKVEKMKEESLERFNAAKAADFKKLREEYIRIRNAGDKIMASIDDSKAELAKKQALLDNAEKDLAEKSEALKKHNADAEKKLTSAEDLLAQKPEYAEVCEQIKKLEAEMNAPTVDEEGAAMIEDLRKALTEATEARENLLKQLAVKEQYDKVVKQIEGIKKERKALQEQLDDYDEKLKAANDYQHKACKVLEENVNKHFGLVKWSMFRRQLDGTEKPWCEYSVDGVPYSDLNSAAKINAGLDIIDALKRYYEADVPCVIDNAETVLEPLYAGGQQIRLTVTEDENIIIEHHDDKDEA